MMTRRTAVRFLAGVVSAGAGGMSARLAADDKSEPKEKKRSGTVVGALTAKGDVSKGQAWIEVKADGEEKARKYVPHWVGGAPKDGGGPDKKVMAKIKTLEVGSRVRLEWEFEERPRVVKVEVLKAPDKAKAK